MGLISYRIHEIRRRQLGLKGCLALRRLGLRTILVLLHELRQRRGVKLLARVVVVCRSQDLLTQPHGVLLLSYVALSVKLILVLRLMVTLVGLRRLLLAQDALPGIRRHLRRLLLLDLIATADDLHHHLLVELLLTLQLASLLLDLLVQLHYVLLLLLVLGVDVLELLLQAIVFHLVLDVQLLDLSRSAAQFFIGIALQLLETSLELQELFLVLLGDFLLQRSHELPEAVSLLPGLVFLRLELFLGFQELALEFYLLGLLVLQLLLQDLDLIVHGRLVLHLNGEAPQVVLDFGLVLLYLLVHSHGVDLHELLHLGVLCLHVAEFDPGLLQFLDQLALDLLHFVDLSYVLVLLLLFGLLLQLRLFQLLLLDGQVHVNLILQLSIDIL